jgi:hypothetical protein
MLPLPRLCLEIAWVFTAVCPIHDYFVGVLPDNLRGLGRDQKYIQRFLKRAKNGISETAGK